MAGNMCKKDLLQFIKKSNAPAASCDNKGKKIQTIDVEEDSWCVFGWGIS